MMVVFEAGEASAKSSSSKKRRFLKGEEGIFVIVVGKRGFVFDMNPGKPSRRNGGKSRNCRA